MSLFFHEDDYGKIEILPRSNAAWCRDQLAEAGTLAHAAKVGAGVGWVETHEPGEAAERLGALGLVESAVDRVIPEALARDERVESGAADRREPVERTRGYRIGRHGALYVAWTDEAVVRAIWMVDGVEDDKRAPLAQALGGLGGLAPLLLVDWRGALVDLRDPAGVQGYVGALRSPG